MTTQPDEHVHVTRPGQGPECVTCIQSWVARCDDYRRQRDLALDMLKGIQRQLTAYLEGGDTHGATPQG